MTVQAPGTGPQTQATGPGGPVLSLQHIHKTYPGTHALVDVSLDLSAGEVHCLIGENGAGKSTLMKILAGVVQPDQGSIVLRGESHRHLTPRSALQLGISTIYQESDLVTSLTVAENVFLGQEPIRALDVVDTGEQRRITRAIIDDLGVDLDPDELGARLSPAQRQVTMIVRALRILARRAHPGRADLVARAGRDGAPPGPRAAPRLAGHRHHLHLPLPG